MNAAVRGNLAQRLSDRRDMRAPTSASGTFARCARTRICGHSSDSTKIAASGRQRFRKRLTGPAPSSGANWCTQRGGIRAAIIAADVGVAEVIRNRASGSCRPRAAINGSTDRLSPTEAA